MTKFRKNKLVIKEINKLYEVLYKDSEKGTN